MFKHLNPYAMLLRQEPGDPGSTPPSDPPADPPADPAPNTDPAPTDPPVEPQKKPDLISGDDEPKDPPSIPGDELTPESFKELLGEEAAKFNLDDDSTKEFLTALNGATSRQDLAKVGADLASKVQAQAVEALTNEFNQMQEEGQQKIRSSYASEEAMKVDLAKAKEVAQTYGGDDMLQLMRETGAGNNPAMLAFLLKVNEAIPTEGRPITGDPAGITKTRADRMFNE